MAFICADRWMKNRYGGPLRQLVAEQFHLKAYIDMVNTEAFHSDVIAYPAIMLIVREKPGATRIAHRPKIELQALTSLAASLSSLEEPEKGGAVREVECVARGADPWILESSDQLDLLRRLESAFPQVHPKKRNSVGFVPDGAASSHLSQRRPSPPSGTCGHLWQSRF